jgi:photosystem II stability/assembly factor-like uncharacterized protein
MGHVHGLEVNPADGSMWAATHSGVFELGPDGPVRAGDRRQDVMGFAITGPDLFLASGHPDPRDGGAAADLGLVMSTDRGRTWSVVALHGEADFHALSAAGTTVYGFDATDGVVMRSDDGGRTWQTGVALDATDLDVDPADPVRVVAATPGGLVESVTGGAGFAPLLDQPPQPLVLIDHVDHEGRGGAGPVFVGVDAAGGVWERGEDGWSSTGSLPGAPQAFTVAGPDRYLAATGSGVHASEDAGRTWTVLAAVA